MTKPPVSVPAESRPTTLDTFLGDDLSGRSLPELLHLAAQMLTERGDGPVADCLRDKAYQAEAALVDAASSSLLPVGRHCDEISTLHDGCVHEPLPFPVAEPVAPQPQTVTVPAIKLIEIRNLIAREEYNEAYHVLYSLADPTFTELEPWKKWEKLASLPAGESTRWTDQDLYDAYLHGCEDDSMPEPLDKGTFLASWEDTRDVQ